MATDATNRKFVAYKQPIKRREGGYFMPSYGRETIRNSIVTILLTRLGERVHLPEFGSRLYELVFEQLDDVFRVLAQQYVFDAISAWEPRVNILSTSVIFPLNQPHVAHLSMIYIIRGPGGYRDSLTLGINRQIGSIMVV